jgi:sulfur-oxidizing protein SoxZ
MMSNIKIKAKAKDGIVNVKTKLKHKMMTYAAAKKKAIEANFITQVIAKVGDKIVYELSSSQFISADPILKFKFHGKKGEMLEIAWIDMSGKKVTESKKIK